MIISTNIPLFFNNPNNSNNQTQLFSTIKHFHYHTKIPRKISKSPNKLSHIINITYLPSNYLKKKTLNKIFRFKPPYHRSNNPTIENEICHRRNVPHVEQNFSSNFHMKMSTFSCGNDRPKVDDATTFPYTESHCHSHSTFSSSFISLFSFSFVFLFVFNPPNHQVAHDLNTIQRSLMIILISFVLLKDHNTDTPLIYIYIVFMLFSFSDSIHFSFQFF